MENLCSLLGINRNLSVDEFIKIKLFEFLNDFPPLMKVIVP